MTPLTVMTWLGLAVTALFWVWSLMQVLPPEADLPPCHLMASFLILAMFTWYLFRADRPAVIPPGHCRKCGYDLTGNISGVCPECGERI